MVSATSSYFSLSSKALTLCVTAYLTICFTHIYYQIPSYLNLICYALGVKGKLATLWAATSVEGPYRGIALFEAEREP